MADNAQKIKDMISEKPMTLSDIAHRLSISHRQAKKALHEIEGLKFATHEGRRYYSLSEERLERIEPSKTTKSGRPVSRRGISLPSFIDYLPFDKRAVMVYLIIMVALSLYLKSAIDILPIGDERLYAAAGIQAVNGKSFIYEHPQVSNIFFGMATYFMPLDYSPVLELPGNWYYGVSHPAVVAVLREALPGMRTVPIIFSFLLAGVMFYYSRRLYGTRAALLVFFMATLSVNMLLFSTALLLEIVMLFFGTATILFYALDYVPDRSQKKALVLFILMTLTLGTRAFTPFILFSAVALAEIGYTIMNRKIDPVIWVALIASVLAFFAYYPPQNMTAAYQQFTVISGGGRNMLVPMLSHITLLVMLFVPVALYKYIGGLAGGRKVQSGLHALFLAAIITGAFSLYIGKFRYAAIALPFLYMVMPFAFRKSGAALKNLAIALVALALISSFYYFPYFDSFNNLVSRGIGIYDVDSREHLVGVHSYLDQAYSGEHVWTDNLVLIYSEIPMTGFYDYDVALDVNGNVILEGRHHAYCSDADAMKAHVEEMGYDLFIETDDALVEARCPGLKDLLEQTEKVYTYMHTDIYKF